jgi:hypothetical protein
MKLPSHTNDDLPLSGCQRVRSSGTKVRGNRRLLPVEGMIVAEVALSYITMASSPVAFT